MITLKDYLTASGKYPDREKHSELNDELLANAEELLKRVNAFLMDLGVVEVKVSSGFRPSSVNASLPNSAKKSLHMQCKAIDLEDPNGELDALFVSNPSLKTRHNLWQENPASTKSWAHLDIGIRWERPSRIFNP